MLRLLNHPLADHLVTQLRNRETQPQEFRELTYRIGLLLALESTKDLSIESVMVETPLEVCSGNRLSEGLLVVPVLRAGIAMVPSFTDLFPNVSVGYIGMERDHVTALARNYYSKLPSAVGKRVLVLDPMLATGGSARQSINLLKGLGCKQLALVCVVAAPEGVSAIEASDPEIPIYAAMLDRTLDSRKYILPGLGDYGDRLYGT
ncbi:MAG: uracil phosphoribosyltransferase [Verrucomicrobia bacterium]|nr:uracil phosphoribosyltransferase [Verrucomicrobiota bacterium]